MRVTSKASAGRAHANRRAPEDPGSLADGLGLAPALRVIQSLIDRPAPDRLDARSEQTLRKAADALDAARARLTRRSADAASGGGLLARLASVRERLTLHLWQVNRARIARMRAAFERGDFEASFQAAEEIIGAWWRTAEDLETVMCPTDRDGSILPAKTMYVLLAKVGSGPWPARRRSWYKMLRVLLLDRLSWSEQAFLESAALRSVPRRCGWMRVHRGLMLQRLRLDFTGAREEFEAVLAAAPWFWKAGAFAAESALCQGDAAGALQLMDRLIRGLGPADRTNCMAWRGAMKLWSGDYAGALGDLDSAGGGAALGLCWKGAANFLMGHWDQAEAQLSACIEQWPNDQEALVWRGELYCRRGRCREGIRDFDRAIELGNAPVWGYINRARAKARLGDEAGTWLDFYAISDRVRAYFEWKLGVAISRGASLAKVARFLDAILKAGGGIRRQDVYLFPLWMPPPR